MALSIVIRLEALRGISSSYVEVIVDGPNFTQILNQIRQLKTEMETRFPEFVWNIKFPFHDIIFRNLERPKPRDRKREDIRSR